MESSHSESGPTNEARLREYQRLVDEVCDAGGYEEDTVVVAAWVREEEGNDGDDEASDNEVEAMVPIALSRPRRVVRAPVRYEPCEEVLDDFDESDDDGTEEDDEEGGGEDGEPVRGGDADEGSSDLSDTEGDGYNFKVARKERYALDDFICGDDEVEYASGASDDMDDEDSDEDYEEGGDDVDDDEDDDDEDEEDVDVPARGVKRPRSAPTPAIDSPAEAVPPGAIPGDREGPDDKPDTMSDTSARELFDGKEHQGEDDAAAIVQD